jgi:arylformamidase
MQKKIQFTYQNKTYQADCKTAIDISMPLKAGEETVNCYYANAVEYQTIAVGDFVGAVNLGGSCNYQRISFTPHGNGTHTECYGHITADGATINECLKEFLFFALLISVPVEILENGDSIISLENIKKLVHTKDIESLIIRTIPNEISKLTHQYSGTNPTYLLPEVCQYLKELGIKHLLIDLPSVDKEWDNGVLQSHRNFWNLPPRYATINMSEVRKDCTITELIFVPATVADGLYLLNLQIVSFESDASPSKPILYPLSVL